MGRNCGEIIAILEIAGHELNLHFGPRQDSVENEVNILIEVEK
jgi:hypothetical protein